MGGWLFCFLFEMKYAIFLAAMEKDAGEEESASETLKRRRWGGGTAGLARLCSASWPWGGGWLAGTCLKVDVEVYA